MNRLFFATLMFVAAVCIWTCSATVTFANLPEANEPAALAAEEHGKHAASSDPLSIDSAKRDLAIWSLIVFLIVLAILWKFAFGPIAKALQAREESVAEQIASANRLNEEAKSILQQYHQKIDDSKDEVRQILETARQNAERNAAAIIQKAHSESELLQERSKKEIEAATVNALQSIAEKSATLATNLASRMIRAEVKPDSHRDIIQAVLNDFKRP
jgi:F-type H+-transporting ATPase subunit b